MKALSVKEPFASQIANGDKVVEFRTWQTKHRGDLLICCSAFPKSENSGKALCIVNLAEIKKLKNGEYGWCLFDVQKLEKPFPVRGKLHVFEVEMPA